MSNDSVPRGSDGQSARHRAYKMMTAVHWRNRERVLGGRFFVHLDTDLAAEDVAERLGGLGPARRWARDLLDALDRRSR